MPEADEDRNCIQGEVDGGEWNIHVPKMQADLLDEKGDPVKTSGQQISGADKAFDIQGQNKRGRSDDKNSFHIF